jgi:predicted RNA methylase
LSLHNVSSGEILFSGVTRILDPSHLDGATVRTLYDLGSGCGRLCVQAFLQFNNIERVVGVEVNATLQA